MIRLDGLSIGLCMILGVSTGYYIWKPQLQSLKEIKEKADKEKEKKEKKDG